MSPETPIKHRTTRELLKGHLLGRGAARGGRLAGGGVGMWGFGREGCVSFHRIGGLGVSDFEKGGHVCFGHISS